MAWRHEAAEPGVGKFPDVAPRGPAVPEPHLDNRNAGECLLLRTSGEKPGDREIGVAIVSEYGPLDGGQATDKARCLLM